MAKQNLLREIMGLLDAERVDLRCAAALVLGSAGKGNAAVVKALARKLDDENPMMRRFVLDALEAMGARGLSAELTPLIGTTDDEVRSRALRLLSAQGPTAEGVLRKELGRGMPAGRRMVAGLLAKLGTNTALDALYEHLSDPDIGEHVLQVVRQEIDRGDPRVRALFHKRAGAAVKKLAGKVGRKTAPGDPIVPRLASVLRLVGYLAEPTSLPLLVANSSPRMPTAIRLAAIAAMRRILTNPRAKGLDAAVAALIEYAVEEDAALTRAAVDTLRGARIPEGVAKKFAALAKADNPEARKLALERMPAIGSAAAIPTLLESLTATDVGARDAATRALATAPEAAGPVARALAEARDADVARRLGQVLRAHEGRVPPAAVELLIRRAMERQPKDHDPVGATQLEALAHLAPDAHARILFERAARLRRSGRYAEAFGALRPLSHTGAKLDDDQRFFLGVLGLKVGGKDLLRAARGIDPVLQQFQQLVALGYPVAKSLLRQRELSPDELFSLGFNFVESRDEDEKELGRELLEGLVKKHPRGKIAVAAKNKLKLAA